MNADEEFDIEKYTKSAEYKKVVKNHSEKLYFNKKYREKLKESYLELEEEGEKALQKLNKLDGSDIQTRKTILLYEGILDLAETMRTAYEAAENFQKTISFIKARFKLLKKGRRVVFACSFVRKSTGKKGNAYIDIPQGLPKGKGKRKCLIVRNKFKSEGFKTKDKGGYKQEILDFNTINYTFRGNSVYKFQFKNFKRKVNKGWIINYRD